MGFGVWGLGFGVWGLGFQVQGLGFGGWKSNLRCASTSNFYSRCVQHVMCLFSVCPARYILVFNVSSSAKRNHAVEWGWKGNLVCEPGSRARSPPKPGVSFGFMGGETPGQCQAPSSGRAPPSAKRRKSLLPREGRALVKRLGLGVSKS